MIIARASDAGKGEFLILGLSRKNLDRLTDGQPIRMTPQTHGDGVPAGWTINILFGETEGQIVKDLQEAGLLSQGTKIHADPRL